MPNRLSENKNKISDKYRMRATDQTKECRRQHPINPKHKTHD